MQTISNFLNFRVKHYSVHHTLRAFLPVVVLAGSTILAACNAKEDEAPAYEPVPSVAVTKFVLSSNSKVMENLDSVFFSIDLDRGIIFNADSLPKGTPVDKLVPVITYSSGVKKALIKMTGGSTREGEVNYTDSPTDSIDFTGKVTLTLSTADDALTRTYTVKVNVHKMVADSLMWDRTAVASLPSRLPSPKEQRTVSYGDKVITLIRESDNSLTLASCLNPSDNNWEKTELALPFEPALRSLNATDDSLYILSSSGELFSSSDAEGWVSTGFVWHTVIGGYGSQLLGIIRDSSGGFAHDIYPRPEGYSPVAVSPDFPVEAMSQFNSFSSKWASTPIGFFIGGRRGNTLSGDSWSYDGTSWANTSNNPLPPLENPLIIPYFNYRKTSTSWLQTEYSVWLCIGGRMADGSVNPSMYLSYDNGVNWMKADSLLQLPDYIHPSVKADAVIRNTPMSARLDAYWRSSRTELPKGARISYFVDGTDVEWDCPYIYMFGGEDSQGRLRNVISRGVLARLTFSPLF